MLIYLSCSADVSTVYLNRLVRQFGLFGHSMESGPYCFVQAIWAFRAVHEVRAVLLVQVVQAIWAVRAVQVIQALEVVQVVRVVKALEVSYLNSPECLGMQ